MGTDPRLADRQNTHFGSRRVVGGVGPHEASALLGLLKRHEVQVLRRAGHSQAEVSRLTGVSLSEIRRIEAEDPVESYDDAAERRRRGIGRPSKAEPLRAFVVERLADNPTASSLDLLSGRQGRRVPGQQERVLRARREAASRGDEGGRRGSARSPATQSHHGFGEVDVQLRDGGTAARALLRLPAHLLALVGGHARAEIAGSSRSSAPSSSTSRASAECPSSRSSTATTRRPSSRTSRAAAARGTLRSRRAMLDLGIGVDLRGRGPHERSGGSVERLVRWVKTSFFGPQVRGRRRPRGATGRVAPGQ